MTYYKVNAPACNSIFSKVEGECSNASTAHTSVSGDIDTLGSLCTGKSAKLAARLNAVYNRVLTAGMTGAEQQITDAVAGDAQPLQPFRRGTMRWRTRPSELPTSWTRSASRMGRTYEHHRHERP